MALIGGAIFATGIMTAWLYYKNGQKQRMIESGEAAKFTDKELAVMGDESPYFRYVPYICLRTNS